MYHIWYIVGLQPMLSNEKMRALFFRNSLGEEPVRQWLLEMGAADRKIIAADLLTVEYGWPVGMPLCRPIRGELWKIRSCLTGQNRIASVLFCTKDQNLVLLHGFMNEADRTSLNDFQVALNRRKELYS